MKKLKEGSPHSVLEDFKIRFKHETLSQEMEDLQKDAEAMKRKLRIMKQKKLTLSTAVRFLKQRYNYLKSNPPTLTRRKGVNDKKGKSNSKKQMITPSTNRKEKKIYDETDTQIFNLRGLATSKFLNFDLNQGKRFHGGSEAGKRIVAPIFDLNQVSTVQEADEMPLKFEEMKKRYMRVDNGDEHGTETKMSICRSLGNGSRRVGKRKISWQDQVALRVRF